ncbi:MAG TPA: hypothetical protein VHW01_28150 [Polyangiaceae bacterium]|jgi:hypothetical protein|nr:hypothetical protein [Polyangiaceae bacterium]
MKGHWLDWRVQLADGKNPFSPLMGAVGGGAVVYRSVGGAQLPVGQVPKYLELDPAHKGHACRSRADQRRLGSPRGVADLMGDDMDDETYEALGEMVDEDSRARRADPMKFVCEVIEPLRDSDVDGFLKIWRTKATCYRWYADDAMVCLERVLANPPSDLVEQMRQGTGFVLNHVTPSKITAYTHDEVVEWLRGLAEKMRVVYAETAKK